MADYSFKIIVVGESGVGKTSIVNRYVKRVFPEYDRPTIGTDIGIRLIQINDAKVQLKIWDSAGSERFKSLTRSYYRNADAAILVYSINDSQSLYELQSWSQEVNNYGNMVRILVGNKADLEENRVISEDIAVNFALMENIDLAIECSARVDQNIDYLFHTAAKKLLKKHIEKINHIKITLSRENIFKYPGLDKSMNNLFLSPRSTKTDKQASFCNVS